MATRKRPKKDPRAALGESLARRLELAPPPVRQIVEQLVARDAPTRMAGLDAVLSRLLPDGALADDAAETLPFLLGLATSSDYPAASALLLRITHLLSALDDPPRSLAGARGTEAARRAFDVIGAERGRLVRVARSSNDPLAARLAACLLARFPDADVDSEPLLIALLSGTSDPEQRAPLLYALTRVQASRGAAFQGRIAAALQLEEQSAERLAVSLALAEHAPPEPLRGRVVATLRTHLSMEAPSDPRSWGRRAAPSLLPAALARLGA